MNECQPLLVGRWIYLDSRKNHVFAAHSLLLCLFFGPTGAGAYTSSLFSSC